MKNLILATIISSSLLIANNGVALPEYDLVKKDFINGEINNERSTQIILKDPRLVPKSRGGLKDDVDANSDGLGVLVIGKILNGSVDSIELKNDNSNVNNKLNYLIEKYGDDAKSAGMSTIDYVKNGVQTGFLSGDEADIIKNNLSRDDIVSVELSSSNINPFLSDIVTINSSIVGNQNNSVLNYQWDVSNNVNIENDNGDNIIISFNEPGPFSVNINVVDPDGNGEKILTNTINVNTVSTIRNAYQSSSGKSEGILFIEEISTYATWNGTYWTDSSTNQILRYQDKKLVNEIIKFTIMITEEDKQPNIYAYNKSVVTWYAHVGAFIHWNWNSEYSSSWNVEGEHISYNGTKSVTNNVTNERIHFYTDLTEDTTVKEIAIDTCNNLFGGVFTSVGKVTYSSNNPNEDTYEYNGYTCLKNVHNYTCDNGYVFDNTTKSCLTYLPH
jgi:hypothetical protein